MAQVLLRTKPGVPNLTTRLKAWWEGYEVRAPKSRSDDADSGPVTQFEEDYEDPADAKMAVVQAIWGKGFLCPGDAEYIKELAKPLRLNEEKSLLYYGAGLGGPMRVLAEEFNVWATGYEQDLDLVNAGMEQSTMAGLAKKAPVQYSNPKMLEIPQRKFDAAIIHDAYSLAPDKRELSEAVTHSLRSAGEMLIIDYALANKDQDSPTLKKWQAEEPNRVDMWTVEEYSECLSHLGLDLRIADDISDTHHNMIIAAWSNWQVYLEHLKGPGGYRKRRVEALVNEAARWTLRAAALKAGDLKFMRYYAIRKPSGIMMSDW